MYLVNEKLQVIELLIKIFDRISRDLLLIFTF